MGMVLFRSSVSGIKVISRTGPTRLGMNSYLCWPTGVTLTNWWHIGVWTLNRNIKMIFILTLFCDICSCGCCKALNTTIEALCTPYPGWTTWIVSQSPSLVAYPCTDWQSCCAWRGRSSPVVEGAVWGRWWCSGRSCSRLGTQRDWRSIRGWCWRNNAGPSGTHWNTIHGLLNWCTLSLLITCW